MVPPTEIASADGPASGGTAGTHALRSLRHNWYVFVVCAVLGAAAGYLLSASKPKRYKATAALNFQQNNLGSVVLGSSYIAPTQDPTVGLETDQALVSLYPVAVRTARLMGGAIGARSIGKVVAVTDVNGSSVFSVTASATAPAFAARLANAYARAYVDVATGSARATLDQAAASLTAEIQAARRKPGGASNLSQLEALLARVHTVASLQNGGVQVVGTAVAPNGAYSPRPKLDAAIGLLIGLLIAAAVVGVRRELDTKVRDQAGLEAFLARVPVGHGVLGQIHQDDVVAGGYRVLSEIGPLAEDVQMLQARLRYLDVDQPRRVLMLMSAAAGEGKSTVAFYLAQVYAYTGARVLLIECDLRRPSLAGRLGMTSTLGLAEYLSRSELALDDVVHEVTALNGESLTGSGSLSVMTAGWLPPNPVELLQSARIDAMLAEARSQWDIVVLDSPPIGVVSDALALAGRVDGALLVTRMGKVTYEGLRRVSRDLERAGAQLLGVIANGIRVRHGEYGYYGYRYRDGQQQRDDAEQPSSPSISSGLSERASEGTEPEMSQRFPDS